MKLKYQGGFEAVNSKPDSGEWIEVFVSDWLKDVFAFYAYIRKDNYKEDIEAIKNLMNDLNPGRDIYVELISRSDGMVDFYRSLIDEGNRSDWNALDVDVWEEKFRNN